MNHYFSADGLYSHSLPEGSGRMPRNARRAPLPATPWVKFWPRWNGKRWEKVEDHRQREGAHAQEATLYWLPKDVAGSVGRTMSTVGPLPVGALLQQPT